jgi:hypothetical protein
MRSKYFLGLGLVSLVAGFAGVGCGGEPSKPDGSGGGGGTPPAMKPATTNHDFATATPIEINGDPTNSALVDTKTKDFFKFTGKAGEKILIGVFAQALEGGSNGFDTSIADVVVTLFDANKNQIAQDDDLWPTESVDAQLFTMLPADGDYYLTVEDCHSAFDRCGQDNVSTFDYAVLIADLDKLLFPNVIENTEPNETDVTSKVVPYKLPMGSKTGNYGFYIINGAFADNKDIDAFSLTIPADTRVAVNQRPHANFWLQPMSQNGDGSTANAKVWLVDAADMAKPVIALADQTNYSPSETSLPLGLSVPVELGHQYYVFVQHADGASNPATDFYFMTHFVGSYDAETLEKSPDANDTIATAEPATMTMGFTPGQYFFDGNISVAGTDVDHYIMDVTQGAKTMFLLCNAQRSGSGLRGAKFSLLKADGTPLGANSSMTEVANADATLIKDNAVLIPAGETKVILKVEAASQDPAVTGTYYHCHARFF